MQNYQIINYKNIFEIAKIIFTDNNIKEFDIVFENLCINDAKPTINIVVSKVTDMIGDIYRIEFYYNQTITHIFCVRHNAIYNIYRKIEISPIELAEISL